MKTCRNAGFVVGASVGGQAGLGQGEHGHAIHIPGVLRHSFGRRHRAAPHLGLVLRGAELEVVRMEGWRRDMYHDGAGAP